MDIDRSRIHGKVTFSVFREGRLIYCYTNHNIITTQGDALIADLMSNTPVRQKIDNNHGYIAVGTGWNGINIKSNTWVNTQVGNPQAMASGYPKVKGSWGSANQNWVQYRSVFSPGTLNATGINEACIVSASSPGVSTSCLAYAQITPPATVTPSDTFQVDWEIEFIGS